ncbi:Heat shock factor-binding protein 1, partial [Lamprotornis superbus]
MAETDPKSVQDLTAVVQTLLQQMQDKFQTMSDQIIGRSGRGGARGREQDPGLQQGLKLSIWSGESVQASRAWKEKPYRINAGEILEPKKMRSSGITHGYSSFSKPQKCFTARTLQGLCVVSLLAGEERRGEDMLGKIHYSRMGCDPDSQKDKSSGQEKPNATLAAPESSLIYTT